MKEWKIYQDLYHRLVKQHKDARCNEPMLVDDEIIEHCVRYVLQRDPIPVFPAKSYMVAIIYAKLIEEQYGDDFYEVLNDPFLFCGQDKFFVPYAQASEVYDIILQRLAQIPNWIQSGWAPVTVHYFQLECTKKGLDSIQVRT